MKDATRSAQAVAAYLRAFSDSLTCLPGTTSVDLGHLRAVFTGRPMFNRIYDAVAPSGATAADVPRVSALSLQYGVNPVWIVDVDRVDDEFAKALAGHGFSRTATWLGMARERKQPLTCELPDGLSVEDVNDERAVRQWARVCSEVEGFSALQERTLCELFARLHERRARWRHSIGWINGEPVATASLLVIDRIAALDWVNTRATYRRRGIAAHLAARLLNEATGRYEIAVLTSTPSGESLYRRLGFEDCSRIAAYRLGASRVTQ